MSTKEGRFSRTELLYGKEAVEALAGARESAEDVATANNDANLHAHVGYLLYLSCVVVQSLGVNTMSLLALQALTRELQ